MSVDDGIVFSVIYHSCRPIATAEDTHFFIFSSCGRRGMFPLFSVPVGIRIQTPFGRKFKKNERALDF